MLDDKKIIRELNRRKRYYKKEKSGDDAEDLPQDNDVLNDEVEYPEEAKPWRTRLADILQTMDPYGFERLSQRVLRECGFTQVEVTKKSGEIPSVTCQMSLL